MKTKLRQNETVILTVNQHWFVLLIPALISAVMILLSVFAYFYFPDFMIIGWVISAVFVLYFIYKYIERNNNLWVVTNLRVLDEFGVFSVNSKESPLDKIHNVSYRKPLIGRIFNFGDVHIQTAAEMGSTVHEMLQNPSLLKDTISEQQSLFRQQQAQAFNQNLTTPSGNNSSNNPKIISGEIERLHNLMVKGIITEQEFNMRKAKLLES